MKTKHENSLIRMIQDKFGSWVNYFYGNPMRPKTRSKTCKRNGHYKHVVSNKLVLHQLNSKGTFDPIS